MGKRYLGIDLHRNNFTCCIRLENDRSYLREWKLEDLPHFVRKLRPSDEVAVEMTGNTRLFCEAVAGKAARVAVVDTNQFRVITQSVKNTDANDAQLLALYLSKGLLPEVPMKDKQHQQLASLAQTRDTLVKQRTALKNKINNLLSARDQPGQGSVVQREAAPGSPGTALREPGTAGGAGDRGADPQLESEHCGTGEDHR